MSPLKGGGSAPIWVGRVSPFCYEICFPLSSTACIAASVALYFGFQTHIYFFGWSSLPVCSGLSHPPGACSGETGIEKVKLIWIQIPCQFFLAVRLQTNYLTSLNFSVLICKSSISFHWVSWCFCTSKVVWLWCNLSFSVGHAAFISPTKWRLVT